MARPRKEPRVTEDVMRDLAGIGCTMIEIALISGLSVDTLERRFAEVIEKGRADRRASLRRKQTELALAGDRTMLIWLGKQDLGQTDKSDARHEHSGTVSIAELVRDAAKGD